jgi:hypothetical protein
VIAVQWVELLKKPEMALSLTATWLYFYIDLDVEEWLE